MGMILLDTNAAIYYLQGDQDAIAVIERYRKSGQQYIISTITEVEIFSFPKLSPLQMIEIHRWLEELIIVSVDSIIAREAARIRRLYRIRTPDAIIVATALHYQASVVSRDKGMAKIKEIDVISC